MGIKISANTEKNQQLRDVISSLNQISNSLVFKDLLNSYNNLQTIIKDLTKHKFKDETPQQLNGKVMLQDEIKNLIIEGTGYIRWKQEKPELLEQQEIDNIKETYNIEFDIKKVSKFSFSRNTNNRHDLCYIEVIPLPGFFQVLVATDRVTYGMDELATKEEFIEFLKKESD